jgi:lipopolysaccharide transport system ATP-binding protein
MGMQREEISKKFNEIVKFAGIEKFLDTPVKRYSSGMYVRLAFAVAAHLEPEILVIDEVLAVGDAEFQKKCIGKMDEISRTGKTILFVSHQLGMISQLCNKCILLEKGEIVIQDTTERVIDTYMNRRTSENNSYFYDKEKAEGKDAYIVYQKMVDSGGNEVFEITNDDPIILETKIRVEKFNPEIELALSLQSKMKGRIFTVNIVLKDVIEKNEKEKVVILEVPSNLIAPNPYSWISAIHIPGSRLMDILLDECEFFIVDIGTEFARYEKADYGCILLDNYKVSTVPNNVSMII